VLEVPPHTVFRTGTRVGDQPEISHSRSRTRSKLTATFAGSGQLREASRLLLIRLFQVTTSPRARPLPRHNEWRQPETTG
jgi:hypothetical protein